MSENVRLVAICKMLGQIRVGGDIIVYDKFLVHIHPRMRIPFATLELQQKKKQNLA